MFGVRKHLGEGLRCRSRDLAVSVRVEKERVIALKECLERLAGTRRGPPRVADLI